MEKLRELMKKYTHLVQRYHVQYLAQFDALVLNDTIQVSVDNNKRFFMSLCVCHELKYIKYQEDHQHLRKLLILFVQQI